MTRSLLIASIVLALAGCAAVPFAQQQAAVAKPALSDEMECLVDCLDDGSELCESCAERCLDRRADLGIVASRELSLPPPAFARLPR